MRAPKKINLTLKGSKSQKFLPKFKKLNVDITSKLKIKLGGTQIPTNNLHGKKIIVMGSMPSSPRELPALRIKNDKQIRRKKELSGLPTSQLTSYLNRIKTPEMEEQIQKIHDLASSPKQTINLHKRGLSLDMRGSSNIGSKVGLISIINEERGNKFRSFTKFPKESLVRKNASIDHHIGRKDNCGIQLSPVLSIPISKYSEYFEHKESVHEKLYPKTRMSAKYLDRMSDKLSNSPSMKIQKKREIRAKQNAKLIDDMEKILHVGTPKNRRIESESLHPRKFTPSAGFSSYMEKNQGGTRSSLNILADLNQSDELVSDLPINTMSTPITTIKKKGNYMKGTKAIQNSFGLLFGARQLRGSYVRMETIANDNLSHIMKNHRMKNEAF